MIEMTAGIRVVEAVRSGSEASDFRSHQTEAKALGFGRLLLVNAIRMAGKTGAGLLDIGGSLC